MTLKQYYGIEGNGKSYSSYPRGGHAMKKVSIDFTQGQLDDLYLALDLAIAVMEIEGQGEKEQLVLNNFKKNVHEESLKLD